MPRPLSYLAIHNEFHATFLKAIVRQYVATLLWSENDDEEVPLDSGDNADLPLSDESFLILYSDVLEFLARLLSSPAPVLQAWLVAYPPSDWLITKGEGLGHDLALSRNGHGAGFFDGDWDSPAFPTLGDSLQTLARSLGERRLCVSDADVIRVLG